MIFPRELLLAHQTVSQFQRWCSRSLVNPDEKFTLLKRFMLTELNKKTYQKRIYPCTED